MSMEFCPKCGTMMIPKKEGEQTIFVCPACGFRINTNTKSEEYEISRKIKHTPKEEIVTIHDDELNTLPIDHVVCPKCGYTEAYVWEYQTRAGDEATTIFHRCKRCGYTWREY